MAKTKTTISQHDVRESSVGSVELETDHLSLGKISGNALRVNQSFSNVSIQTEIDSQYRLSVGGSIKATDSIYAQRSVYANGILIDRALTYDGFIMFSPQEYIDSGSWPYGANPPRNFASSDDSSVPFSNVVVSNRYEEIKSEYIPVRKDEVIYGEVWTMRSQGSPVTSGFYSGVELYDSSRQLMSVDYFIASDISVPANGIWNKHSNRFTVPDGVRYIKAFVWANRPSMTSPVHWGGFLVRRQAISRDTGVIEFKGSINKEIRVSHGGNYINLRLSDKISPKIETDLNEFHFNKGISIETGNIKAPGGELSFYSGSSKRLVIKQSGNIGIGVENPDSPLQVAGVVKATAFSGDLSGNSATTTKLKNGVRINNTLFDGSLDITTSRWGTAREIKIGNKAVNLDGSSDASWTLSDIGALGRNETASSASRLSPPILITIGGKSVSFDGSSHVSWTLNEIGALEASNGELVSPLIVQSNKHLEVNNEYGIDMSNSDIVDISGLYINETILGKGINFNTGAGSWDSVYTRNGELYLHPGRQPGSSLSGDKIWHSGNLNPSSYLSTAGGSMTGALKIIVSRSGSGTWNDGIMIESTSQVVGEAAMSFKNKDTGNNQWIVGTGQGANLDISYGSNFSSSLSKVRILTDGKVGIGTLTPTTALQVIGTVSASSFSGNLSGNASTATKLTTPRLINLSGDISGTSVVGFDGSEDMSIQATISSNSVSTPKIENKAVTYAKIQDVTRDRILGRISTAGTVQELTPANVRSLINVSDGANKYDDWKLYLAGEEKANIGSGGIVNIAPGPNITLSYESLSNTIRISGAESVSSIEDNILEGGSGESLSYKPYATNQSAYGNRFYTHTALPTSEALLNLSSHLRVSKFTANGNIEIKGNVTRDDKVIIGISGDSIVINHNAGFASGTLMSGNLSVDGVVSAESFSGNASSATRVSESLTIGTGLKSSTSGSTSYDGSAATTVSVDFGTSASTVCQGNDSRLSNARTPTNHGLVSSTHTVSGLIAGQVIRATGATTYAFENLKASDIPTLNQDTTGNAGSATKLKDARTFSINGSSKSFNGTANISWTLAEIGVSPDDHTHSYLPLSGGTLSGVVSMGGNNITNVNNITIADPGPGEGIEWLGGNLWKIYESPDNLTTNDKGNLQFVQGTTRRMTIGTDGKVSAPGGFSGNLTGDADTAIKLKTSRKINGVDFDGSKDITVPTSKKLVAGTGLTGTSFDGSGTADTTWSVKFGTDASSACVGNDSRLSNARTPTSHTLVGGTHTASGLTAGHVLRATSATAFEFRALTINGVNVGLSDTTIPINVVARTTNANHFLTFTATATQNQQAYTNSALTFNPSTGVLAAGKVMNAVYNDYAEYFLKDEEIEPGDIVQKDLNGEGYIRSQSEYSNLVVGVMSTDFAQCIGGDEGVTQEEQEKKYTPIGLSGRVPVKVIGEVQVGDLIVSSHIPGVGIASKEYIPGTVVGKALEEYNSKNIGKIEMLIMNL